MLHLLITQVFAPERQEDKLGTGSHKVGFGSGDFQAERQTLLAQTVASAVAQLHYRSRWNPFATGTAPAQNSWTSAGTYFRFRDFIIQFDNLMFIISFLCRSSNNIYFDDQY